MTPLNIVEVTRKILCRILTLKTLLWLKQCLIINGKLEGFFRTSCTIRPLFSRNAGEREFLRHRVFMNFFVVFQIVFLEKPLIKSKDDLSKVLKMCDRTHTHASSRKLFTKKKKKVKNDESEIYFIIALTVCEISFDFISRLSALKRTVAQSREKGEIWVSNPPLQLSFFFYKRDRILKQNT